MERFNQDSALLLKTAIDSGITDPEELGCILGNASVETKQYSTMHEDFRYRSVDKLLRAVSSATERYTRQQIQDAIDSKDPVRIATVMYEGRNTGDGGLGNSEPGDGWRFHGRGFFQYTGRENYAKFGKMFDVDLVNNPEIAAEPVMAAKLAIAYWKKKVPEDLRRDAVASGMKINGGDNGEVARFTASERWKKTITHQLVQDIQTGKITLDQLSFHGWDALKDGKLKRNERGMEIREFQHHLNELGIPDAKGRRLEPNGTFDRSTQQAAETFQRQLGMPANSAVTAHTLNAAAFYAGAPEILRKPLQPTLPSELPEMFRESAERMPPAAPPRYQNDWLPRDAEGRPDFLHSHEPATPRRAPAPEVDPVQAQLMQLQRELDALRQTRQPDAAARPEPEPAYARFADREPDSSAYRPQPAVQAFSAHHPDHALFEAIRRQLPPGTSDEMAAHVMLQAKLGGVEHVGKLDEVIVQDGRAYVAGKTPGDMTAVDLSAPVPALQETLRQSATFDTQQAVQLTQFQEQQRAINMPGGGLTMGPLGGGFGMG